MGATSQNFYDVIKNFDKLNSGIVPKPEKPTENFSDILKNFSDFNKFIKPDSDDKGVLGTAIPYLYSLYGDIAVNPSTVSTSEFQKMAYGDPTIYSCITYMMVLIINRIGEFEHENADIKHLVNYSLNNLKIGKRRFLESMLTAIWAGFSAGEKVYGLYDRKIIIENVVPLPAVSLIFRIDTNGFVREDGVVQYFYNNLLTGYANLLSFGSVSPNGMQYPNPQARKGDLDYPLRTPWAQPVGTLLLPRDKLIMFNIHGTDGLMNPYGRSMLRSVYDKYTHKQALLQIAMIGANFKSSPVPIFYVDPTVPITLPNGQTIDLAQDIAQQITRLRGNGFLVINGKKGAMVDNDVINNTADLTQFTQLLTYYNNEIREGLLTPTSLLGNTDGGSYALSLTQSSAHSKFIDSLTEQVCDVLITSFAKDIIQSNWKGEKNWGYFKVNEDTLTDKERLAKILEVGVRANVINTQELKDVNLAREWLGFPETDQIFNPMDMQQDGSYDTSNRNTNIMKARQSAGQPYARNNTL